MHTSSRSPCCQPPKDQLESIQHLAQPGNCSCHKKHGRTETWVVICRGIKQYFTELFLITSTLCVMTHTHQSAAVPSTKDNAHTPMDRRRRIDIPPVQRTEDACYQVSKKMTNLLRRKLRQEDGAFEWNKLFLQFQKSSSEDVCPCGPQELVDRFNRGSNKVLECCLNAQGEFRYMRALLKDNRKETESIQKCAVM